MKKITLIILAFTLNVSFAQVIFSEDFSSYDLGPMAKGNGDTVWEAASRKDDAVDCAGMILRGQIWKFVMMVMVTNMPLLTMVQIVKTVTRL